MKYIVIGGHPITQVLRAMWDEDCMVKPPAERYPFWEMVEAHVLKETAPIHIAGLAAGQHLRTQGEVNEPDVAAVANTVWRQAEEWKLQERAHDSRWVPNVVPKKRRVQWFLVSWMKPPSVGTKELLAAQKKIDKGKDVVHLVAVGSSNDGMIATSELN